MTTPRRLALMTSDTTFVLPALSPVDRLIVDRQPWSDEMGEISPEALVAQMLDADPIVICFAPDVPLELALKIGSILDRDHAAISSVLIQPPSADIWKHATRAGIRDIVDPTAIATDLATSIEVAVERSVRLKASLSAAALPGSPTTKVIVVLSPKGGSGKTMLATNMAVALATGGAGDVALLDLDCIFGDVSSVLGLTTEHTIGKLAALGSFDSTTLKVFLTRHEQSGLYVLASSGAPEEGERVDASIAGRVIELLSGSFSHIVIDTSAGLDERALAAIDRATDIMLLASLDVTSIRNLSKEIDALDRLRITGPTRHFVLNRADARVGIEIAEVEEALGMRAAATLPSTRMVPLSMNQGRSIVADDPDAPVSQQIVALASRFMPHRPAAVTTANKPKSRLFRRR